MYTMTSAISGISYYKDAKCKILHREDGPAREYPRGTKAWYFDNKLHRDDGSAVIWHDGDQDWYRDGKLHRLDGPARIWTTFNTFYVNGVRYKDHNFPKAVANWVSYVEVTKQDLQTILGNYRIVEWK